MMKYLLAILGLIVFVSHCEGAYYGEWGVGYDHPTHASVTDHVKFVELGKEGDLGPVGSYQLGLGAWTDATHYKGANNSSYASAMFGIEPSSDNFYMHFRIGPAVISSPDTLLGSYFQVGQEIGFGFKDKSNRRIGLVFKHFSNGGLSKVNEGRNLIGLKVGF